MSSNSISQITFSNSIYNKLESQSIETTPSSAQTKIVTSPTVTTPRGMTAQDIIRQNNERTMRQMGYNPPVVPQPGAVPNNNQQNSKKEDQIAQIKGLLNEDLPRFSYNNEYGILKQKGYYKSAFYELMSMFNGNQNFSIKRAVFVIENAFLDQSLDYNKYCSLIKEKTDYLKNLAVQEQVSLESDLGINYLIQKLYSQQTTKETPIKEANQEYSYDFEDFWGEKDWTNMFVTKLLESEKGQCHSLPLLYLIFAEEMGAKAWLSLAPEHSYIKFQSPYGLLNFETTNGHIVTDEWLMQSGYINSNSIRNKIYLDTLDNSGVFSTLLSDLIMGYTYKFGYDDYMVSMVDTLVSINPKSIQGQIFRADIYTIQLQIALEKVGNPPIEKLNSYPEAKRCYIRLINQYDLIEGLGYSQMPKDEYENWLNSINVQKDKLNETESK